MRGCMSCLIQGTSPSALFPRLVFPERRLPALSLFPEATPAQNNDALEQMVDAPAGEFKMGITEPEMNDLFKANPEWTRDS
jgi:formylglycine-generating enzyme required for sulfatase activity